MTPLLVLALATSLAGSIYASNRTYLGRSVARDLTDVEDYAVAVGPAPAPMLFDVEPALPGATSSADPRTHVVRLAS